MIKKNKSNTEIYDEAKDNLSFSTALEYLENGYIIAREGWNDENMFIFLVNGSQFKVNRAPLNEIFEEDTVITYCPHIDMRTADGSIVPWLASQGDLLSKDWKVISQIKKRK